MPARPAVPPRLPRLLSGDLADGLRTLLLRRARSQAARAPVRFWWLFALAVLLSAVLGWYEVHLEYREVAGGAGLPPRFDADGLAATLATAGALLLAAWLAVALLRRREALWALATRLLAAWLWFELAWRLVWLALSGVELGVLEPWYDHGFAAWWLLVMARLLLDFDRGGAVLRRLAAAVAAFVPTAMLLWLWLPLYWSPDWQSLSQARAEPEPVAQRIAFDPEAVMYAQPALLDAALDRLAPQRPDAVDLYVVGFAGDGEEPVFRNEVEYLEQLFAQRFAARGRVLTLVNHPDTLQRGPLATRTNLQRALARIGRIMDVEQDILFLFLTTHGSEDHWLGVNMPPLPLNAIGPQDLRGMLDAAGIRWRVLAVSACYSGGFIDALEGPRTLLITAARADRPSFGCGTDSQITYFGRAWLAEALNRNADFVAAFEQARLAVAARERRDDFAASEPQIRIGEDIAAQLARWRAQFEPGPVVPFEPAGEAGAAESGAPEP